LTADAEVVASGYDLFDATRKEEYGYGIYDNVITSPELEAMFREHRVVTSHGTVPKRVALLHCVGSRDEKVGQNHCSRVCCITGIKQAIEIRELYPECEVFNFYMDMRMFGAGYEEMYRASQEKYGVNHIRGRISEVSETIDGRIQLKTEDTLVGRPMRMTADLLVLLVGMCCGAGNIRMAGGNGLELRPTGFFLPKDSFRGNVSSKNPRIFFAGTASAPKNVGESINEGRAAAYGIYEMLKNV
jgi:heterodisulfide reductase subunit A